MGFYRVLSLLTLLLSCLETTQVGAVRREAVTPRDLGVLAKRQQCGSNIQDQCSQSASACVSAICASCADVPEIAQCCALSGLTEEAQCIIVALQGGGGASATTAASGGLSSSITLSPSASSAVNDPNLAACANWESINAQCASETPGFSSLTAFASQASCVCYSSSTYDPARYDGYFASCLSYFSTGDPSGYYSITSGVTSLDLAPCSAAGNVLNAPGSVSASATNDLASTTFASAAPTSTSTAPAFGSPVSQTGSAASAAATVSAAHDAPLKVSFHVFYDLRHH